MDKHILDLYNKALKDYDEVIQKLMEIEEYCKDCNLKTDYTACAVLHIIDRSRVL